MTGHTYEDEVTTKPTCTKKGARTFTCPVCGDSYTLEIPAMGHAYEETVLREATCTKKGLIQKVCKNCGKTVKKNTDMLEHAWVEATCTEARHCSVCGKKDGKALGHDIDSNGKCKRCGQTVNLITIKLKGSSLPRTLNYKGVPEVKLTEFSYKTWDSTCISIYFTGECVYPNATTSYTCHIGYKLYDSEGYVIASGTCRTSSLKYGDKFRGCEESVYLDLPVIIGGTCYLELLDVV